MRIYEIETSTGMVTPRSSMSKEEDLSGTFIGNVCNMVNKVLNELDYNEVHMDYLSIMWVYANLKSLDEDLLYMSEYYRVRGNYGAHGIVVLNPSNFDSYSWKVWDPRRQKYRSKDYYVKEMRKSIDNIVRSCRYNEHTYNYKQKDVIEDILYGLAEGVTRNQV